MLADFGIGLYVTTPAGSNGDMFKFSHVKKAVDDVTWRCFFYMKSAQSCIIDLAVATDLSVAEIHDVRSGRMREETIKRLIKSLARDKRGREAVSALLLHNCIKWSVRLTEVCRSEIEEILRQGDLFVFFYVGHYHDMLRHVLVEKLAPQEYIRILCEPQNFFGLCTEGFWGPMATMIWFFATDVQQRQDLSVFWKIHIENNSLGLFKSAHEFLGSESGTMLAAGLKVALKKHLSKAAADH